MRTASVKSTPSSLIRQLNYIPYRQRNAHLSPKMSVSSKASFYTFKPPVPSKETSAPQQIFFNFSDSDYAGDQVSSPIHQLDLLVEFEKVETVEMISNALNCIVEEPESEKKMEENESSTTEHFEDNKYLGVDDWRECNDVRDDYKNWEAQHKSKRELETAQNKEYHTSQKQSTENKNRNKFTQTKLRKLTKGEPQTVNLKPQIHNPQQKRVVAQQGEANDNKFNETLKKLRQNRREKRESIKIMGKQKETKDINSTTSNKLLKRFKNKNL